MLKHFVSVKTLPLTTYRQILEALHVVSVGTQRRALPRHQSEEMKILNISFPKVVIESTNAARLTVYGKCFKSGNPLLILLYTT